jgi:hypothetical protein
MLHLENSITIQPPLDSVSAKWLKLANLDVSKEVSNEFIKSLDENLRGVGLNHVD